MMSNEGYSDRILTCRDCGQEFTFTAGEQEFYASRNLTNDPSRCPTCRAARRSGGGGQSSSRPRTNTGEYYETTCADCGRATSVPFIPREDRPVYCSDCFQTHRAPRTARTDSRSGGGGYSSGGGGYSSGGGGRSDRSGGRGGRNDRNGGRDRW
jgi:CxxC-x17-CxxC domain-containing protein